MPVLGIMLPVLPVLLAASSLPFSRCSLYTLSVDTHLLFTATSHHYFLPLAWLQLKPLAWSLSFGACLGANATLMGAAANAVALNLARKGGYDISPLQFSKFGVPVALVAVGVTCVYAVLAFGLGGYGGQ